MDNSKMAKADTSLNYDMFEHDKGRNKLSRNIETRKVCDCKEGCHCNCVKVGDPLEWANKNAGGGKIA